MIKRRHIRRVFKEIKELGLRGAARVVFNRLAPSTIEMKRTVLELTNGRYGLEIGGPSNIFKPSNIFPIYSGVGRLDNVNFATHTVWEDSLREGAPFLFNNRAEPGIQFVREASDLTGIVDGTYDFLISSHCLEHVANPISALMEWARVTKPGGHLIVIVPNPVHTFDHRRPVTSIEHLMDDHRRNVGEDDLTHLPEILSLHDLSRDSGVSSPAAFHARSLKNAENRCLHHHVFDIPLLKGAIEAAGGRVLTIEQVRPVHLIALAQVG